MNRKKIYRTLMCFIIAGGLVVFASVQASFLGPPVGSNPPTGGGLFSVDPQRNIGFGGDSATPANALDDGTEFGRVFMVTANNNPGLGLRSVTATINKRFILTVRNSGQLALLDDSINAIRFYVDTNGDFVVGGLGALRATNVIANVSAQYITSGVFGQGLGTPPPTGNFAFPSALGIGTNSTGGLPAKLDVSNTSPAQWTYSGLAENYSLNLGRSDGTGVGSIKLNAYTPGQFVFIRPSNGNLHIDSTTGQYYFNWDAGVYGTNPGIIRMANGLGIETVSLNSNGNSWLTGGNVGIGTNNPNEAKLEIKPSVTTGEAALFKLRNGNDSGAMVIKYQMDRNYVHFRGSGTTPPGVLFTTQDTPVLWVGTNGSNNVGIGTANPGANLEVSGLGAVATMGQSEFFRLLRPNLAGTSYPQLATFSVGRFVTPTNFSPNTRLDINLKNFGDGTLTADATVMTLTSDGNVGIGTTNPSAKLQIHQGTSRLDGIDLAATEPGGATHRWKFYNMNGYVGRYGMELWEYKTGTDGIDCGSVGGGICSPQFVVKSGGNVGIGITNPGYKLDVVGGGRFTGTVLVATPSLDGEAATKGYVDTVVSGGGGADILVKANSCDRDATCDMVSANFPGATSSNITGVNELHVKKIYAQTIDPIYTIGGISYATYVSDTIGLKMEIYGKARLTDKTDKSNRTYWTYTVDFGGAEVGSDLWLFWQTIDEGRDMEDVIVSLTPNFPGDVWYELKPKEKQIIIKATLIENFSPEVSYHLVAPRHDAKKWPIKLDNPTNKGTFLSPK